MAVPYYSEGNTDRNATNQHPISPPPRMVQDWVERFAAGAWRCVPEQVYIANRAAQWGADQELEACCALMDDWGLDGEDLMQCRRPKPPSLKGQALAELAEWENVMDIAPDSPIRRALEQLDD